MKRPLDPDDRTNQAKACLSIRPASSCQGSAPVPKPQPKPLPAEPLRAKNETPLSASLRTLRLTGVPVPPAPKHRTPSPLRTLGGLPPPTRPVLVEHPPASAAPVLRHFTGATSKAAASSGPDLKPAFRGPKIIKPPKGISINASQCSLCVAKFNAALNKLGNLSSLHWNVSQSEHRDDHLRRILSKFASTTILRYLAAWERFLSTLESMQIEIASLTPIQVADAIITLSLARKSDIESGCGCIMSIKSLRWAASTMMVQGVYAVAWDPVISSFYLNKIPREKKEAFPLLLYHAVQIERKLLLASTTESEIMLLGGLLLFMWGSLRFSDGQRVFLDSLEYDGLSLRGVCYQTKTSNQGTPFAVLSSGFLSHGSHSWLLRYLQVLDAAVFKHRSTYPDIVLPASLLLQLDPSGAISFPLQGADYASALRWLRRTLELGWKHSIPTLPALNYTLHSLKVTLLSWANQLPQISAPDRLAQGKHVGGSMELYSRERCIGQLRLQLQIRDAVRSGGRFVLPLHRGAQHPLQEPFYEVESFKKDSGPMVWQHFAFATDFTSSVLPALPPLVPAISAPPPILKIEELQSESECSSEASEGPSLDSMGDVDEFSFGASTNVLHALKRCEHSSVLLHAIPVRSVCGAPLHSETFREASPQEQGFLLCRRLGCLAVFAAAGVES